MQMNKVLRIVNFYLLKNCTIPSPHIRTFCCTNGVIIKKTALKAGDRKGADGQTAAERKLPYQ